LFGGIPARKRGSTTRAVSPRHHDRSSGGGWLHGLDGSHPAAPSDGVTTSGPPTRTRFAPGCLQRCPYMAGPSVGTFPIRIRKLQLVKGPTDMPLLPTANEQIDSVLTQAKTRASGYAADGNLEMAYKALLRGVQSAQRKNNAGQAGTVLRGLWATPAVKGVALAAIPGVLGVVTRSKSRAAAGSKSMAGSEPKPASTPGDPVESSVEPSAQERSRFRLRSRRKGGVVMVDETQTIPDA
jgi:hypothetical protein